MQQHYVLRNVLIQQPIVVEMILQIDHRIRWRESSSRGSCWRKDDGDVVDVFVGAGGALSADGKRGVCGK